MTTIKQFIISIMRTVFIVTDESENVSQELLNRMGVGLTAWAGKGMFSKTEHMTLFCAVNRPDVRTLTAIVNEADPKAFVVVMQGHQARGGRLRQTIQGNNRTYQQDSDAKKILKHSTHI